MGTATASRPNMSEAKIKDLRDKQQADQREAALESQAKEQARRNVELQKQQARIQAEEQRILAAEAKAAAPKGFGRLTQGFPGLGRGKAPPIGGSASPSVQGTAVAQPATKGGILGWLAGITPDNIYGGMVFFAAILYVLDWITGFDIAVTAPLRMIFGIGGFFLLAATSRCLGFKSAAVASVQFYSIFGVLGILTSGGFEFSLLTANTLLFVFLIGSGILYANLQIPNAIKWLPVFMLFETYGLPILRERILSEAASAGYATFIVTFIFNRALFPLPLVYTAFGFYPESKTARKFVAIMVIAYLVASLPQIKGAYAKHAGLSEVETEQAKSFVENIQRSIRSVLTGDFLRPAVASAYERAEQTFGFGEPEEGPKIGLQIVDDPNTPRTFDFNIFSSVTPSIVLSVPNPLPEDIPSRFVEVVDITCMDKSADGKTGELIEPVSRADLLDCAKNPDCVSPVKVSYRVPSTVKCEFAGMPEGSKSVEFNVKYKFSGGSRMSTAFMRSDKLDALVMDPDETVLQRGLQDIPKAEAIYDNGPASITWGPVELANPPSRVYADKKRNLALGIYVANSGTWEGEIAGISNIKLTTPTGIMLDTSDSRCMFEGSEGSYTVPKRLLLRDEKKDPTPDNLKFIGEGVPFTCKMVVSKDVLDSSWTGTKFKAQVDYLFSTKKVVSFKVVGKEKTEAELCAEGGGKWDDAKTPKCTAAPTQSGTPAATSPPQSSSAGAGTTAGTLSGCSSSQVPKTASGYGSIQNNCKAAASGGNWIESTKDGCCICPAGKTWDENGQTGCKSSTTTG